MDDVIALFHGPGYVRGMFDTGVLLKGGGGASPPPPPPRPGIMAERIEQKASAAPKDRRGRRATILTGGLNFGEDSQRIGTILGG